MSEASTPVLSHFATYRQTDSLWRLAPSERRARALEWVEGIADSCDAVDLYLVQATEAAADILVWASQRVAASDGPARFFKARAAGENPHRVLFEPRHVLWGMTRPSEYSKAGRSAQEIDPFARRDRAPYLVVYPFAKTAEWYLMGRETRQGMMSEHIRIGKQYRDITQLLLYSFGVQDQEFVVAYETEDMARFSALVHELRDTQARRYTLGDTPLHAGIHIEPEEWAGSLA